MDKPAISLRLRFFAAGPTQHYASLAMTTILKESLRGAICKLGWAVLFNNELTFSTFSLFPTDTKLTTPTTKSGVKGALLNGES